MRAALRFVAKTSWKRTHNQKPGKSEKNRKALEEQSKQ
jgi:hypothetical protein